MCGRDHFQGNGEDFRQRGNTGGRGDMQERGVCLEGHKEKEVMKNEEEEEEREKRGRRG